MSSEFRLVPAPNDGASKATMKDTVGATGLHDTMRFGLRSLAAEANGRNPLQSRLENWEETQDSLKLNLQRNIYGLHAPVRQLMERRLVSENPHMPGLGNVNIHLDILMGRDETLDVADFFGGALDVESGPLDVRGEMERRRRILQH
ncbi:proteasome maturation factor UMP1 [Exidia glandulosa HHB12029]|uniref:Proteasome maturation factor UMP1 n=1 Tax=Exidia glandulosa HHB12029 TaxID=1314781 RepID=A0A165C0Z2_EXIGL|nr:proteasome maturation factor UMP1 [Exidia glandulosa HHB12029]